MTLPRSLRCPAVASVALAHTIQLYIAHSLTTPLATSQPPPPLTPHHSPPLSLNLPPGSDKSAFTAALPEGPPGPSLTYCLPKSAVATVNLPASSGLATVSRADARTDLFSQLLCIVGDNNPALGAYFLDPALPQVRLTYAVAGSCIDIDSDSVGVDVGECGTATALPPPLPPSHCHPHSHPHCHPLTVTATPTATLNTTLTPIPTATPRTPPQRWTRPSTPPPRVSSAALSPTPRTPPLPMRWAAPCRPCTRQLQVRAVWGWMRVSGMRMGFMYVSSAGEK